MSSDFGETFRITRAQIRGPNIAFSYKIHIYPKLTFSQNSRFFAKIHIFPKIHIFSKINIFPFFHQLGFKCSSLRLQFTKRRLFSVIFKHYKNVTFPLTISHCVTFSSYLYRAHLKLIFWWVRVLLQSILSLDHRDFCRDL